MIAGTLVMIGAAIVAVAALVRRSVADDNDAEFQPPTGSSAPLLTVGERTIERIRRHPVLACSATATVGALTAMSHAETTVAAGLIWGAIEAVAVVAGFILLGPRRGLHQSSRRATPT